MKKFLLIWVTIIFACLIYAVDIDVNSNITSNTTWYFGNTYIIHGYISVNSTATLTIQEGVIVEFASGSQLLVVGSILANGTDTFPIDFLPFNYNYEPSNRGTRLKFDNGGSGQFTYCNFEAGNAYDGLLRISNNCNGVTFNYCNFEISDSGPAIYSYNSSCDINVSNSTFWNLSNNGVHLRNTSGSVILNNNSFNNCSSTALKIQDSSSSNVLVNGMTTNNVNTSVYINCSPTFNASNLTISNSSSYPIEALAHLYDNFTNMSINTDGTDHLLILGSSITSDCTLPDFSVPYLFDNHCSITSGDTLTIDPGTIVHFEEFNILTVNGAIQANGTSTNPIYFDSNNGHWCSIRFSSSASSSFDYCHFDNGGYDNQYGYDYQTFYISDIDSLYVGNSSFNGGQSSVLYTHSNFPCSITLDTVTINGCSGYGINMTNDEISLATNNLTITNCDDAIKIHPNSISGLSLPTLSGNLRNSFLIAGSGNIGSMTFYNYGYPYEILNSLYTHSWATITIEPGTEMQFRDYVQFRISGALIAEGTQANPITFDTTPLNTENWYGVLFYAGSTRGSLINCSFNNGGVQNPDNGSVQDMIYLSDVDSLYISDVTITNSEGRGIYSYQSDNGDILVLNNVTIDNCVNEGFRVDGSYLQTDITNIQISNCNAYPVRATGNAVKGINSISLSSNSQQRILLHRNAYVTNNVIRNFGYPYEFDTNYFEYGSTTIEPGVTILLRDDRQFSINSQIFAQGTSDNHITFDRPNSSEDNWFSIVLRSSSYNAIFEYCDFNYGGGVNSSNGSITPTISVSECENLEINNCTISNSDGYGLGVIDSNSADILTINNLDIDNVASDGVVAFDSGVNMSIDGLNVNNANGFPLIISVKDVTDLANLQFTNNTHHYIKLENSGYIDSETIHNFGIPYLLMETINLYGNQTLIIEPGVELYIDDSRGFTINGNISAVGTPSQPITFNKSPFCTENWQTIQVRNGGNGDFEYCEFNDGGETSPYGHHTYTIFDEGASRLRLDNCAINNSLGTGLFVDGTQDTDSLYVRNVSIDGFVTNGIRVDDQNLNALVENITVVNGSLTPMKINIDQVDSFQDVSYDLNSNDLYYEITSTHLHHNATWSNTGIPYKMTRTSYITDWDVLTLEAGVELHFSDEYSLFIQGGLNCNGTLANPVIMRSTTTGTDSYWNGIRFQNTEYDSNIDYLIVENAGFDEAYSYNHDKKAVYVENSTVNFSSCQFRYSDYHLFASYGNSDVTITDCYIGDCDWNGMIIDDGTVTVVNSEITNCQNKGIHYDSGTINFGTNSTQWNKVHNNTNYNFYNNSQTVLSAPYVYWGSTDELTVDATIYDDEEGNGRVDFAPWYDETCTILNGGTIETPFNITITELSPTQLRIGWDVVSNATSYKVYSADDPSSDNWQIIGNGITELFFDINPNNFANKQFFKVTAIR